MTHPSRRRGIGALIALTLALALPVATVGRTPASAEPRPVKASMQRHTLHVLPSTAAAAAGTTTAPATRPEAVSDEVALDGKAHVVGVTWPRGAVSADAVVEIRERGDRGWGEWTPMDTEGDDAPDPGSPEDLGSRGGTSAWITTATAVQVRVVGDTKGAGRAATFDVVDATVTDADRTVGAAPAGAASAAAVRPTIYTRAQWGADESIRHAILDYGTIKAAVVHHTVGSNSYTASEVPSIIRGIYLFHTNGRGWGDIGYNFLVDRFGKIWEGRYGGIDRPVVGAQAGGFNSQTYGASTLGTFSTTVPPSAVLTAQAKLAAWKLGLTGIDPTATTTIDGAGTRYTVMGHRNLNSTECPGDALYARLPTIRSLAKGYQGTAFYTPTISRTGYAYGGAGVTVTAGASTNLRWTLRVISVCQSHSLYLGSGTASGSTPVRAVWDGRDDKGALVPPGDYTVQLRGTTGTGTLANAVTTNFTLRVTPTASSPPGYCPTRLSGANRYDTAVAVAGATDAAARTVVIASGDSGSVADSLVAAPFARHVGGVLLLSGPGGLTAGTKADITRRGATTAYLIGGSSSVPTAVETQLAALGVTSVQRLAGPSRYATAVAVARQMGATQREVFVASGSDESFVDGLTVSGPASRLDRPVLFVRPDLVPDETAKALSDLGVRATVVAGGTSSVSSDVLAQLPGATRLSGANRFATAVAVADWARSRMSVQDVVLSSGESGHLVDMLAAGQLGRVHMTTLASSLPSEVDAWLQASPDLASVTVVGGVSAVGNLAAGAAQRSVLE